jgi:transcription initiation factor TFIIIB Brf1 subunit/transcription initiation factor TFIIB
MERRCSRFQRWQPLERQIAELRPKLFRQIKSQKRVMTALEAEVTQLKEAAGVMTGQAALPTRVDRSEAQIARVASEAAELHAAVVALTSWTGQQ